MQKLTDGCALLLPELTEGRTIDLLISPQGDGVTIAAPLTTLPRLSAATHSQDRFRTEEKRVPITAKGGVCTAQRTQYWEGRAGTSTEYLFFLHSEEGMGTGDCAEVPLPCATVATLAVRWCPRSAASDCIFRP